MSYCFNPNCSEPENELQENICSCCGTNLLFRERYRGIKLLGKSQLALTIEVKDIKSSQPEQTYNSRQNQVLKILLTDYPKAVELFKQEGQILAQMNHQDIPKIVTNGYFSFQPSWSQKPVHCLLIEKIQGLDLEQWLKKRNYQPITQVEAQKWLKQLLNILVRLHQQRYFHRDIKPANIILQPNGKLALIDFGAARKITTTYLGKVGAKQGVTSIGTPGYIAPEQINGAAIPQSDFFALGRTMVHLLTGKHPQKLPKSQETGEILWRTEAPQVSSAFADLLDWLMKQIPSQRPVSIKAIRDALSNVQKYPHKSRQARPSLRFFTLIVSGVILFPFLNLIWFGWNNKLQPIVTNNIKTNVPLCSNLNCINRDPIDHKCDRDAITVTSDTGNYPLNQYLLKAYRLDMRFSATCQATWSRTEAPPHSNHYIEDSRGNKYGTATVPVDQWQRHDADMAPGKSVKIRACTEPPQGNRKCTKFVQF